MLPYDGKSSEFDALYQIEEVMTMNGKKVLTGTGLLVGNMDNMVRFYRDACGGVRGLI